MSAKLSRIAFSVVTRNIVTFLVILTLVVVPLVVRYLGDVRELKSETIRVQLDAVAELGRFMLDAGAVAQVRNAIWYGTAEHEGTLRALATIQRNFQVDNAVLMRRGPDGQFIYIGDGSRQFGINQPVDLHRLFPATLPPARTAWESGRPSQTELFRSGDSSWFQVYTPLKRGDRVVGLLLLNRFATPVASAIAQRQREILLGMTLALAGGIFVWWFITTRSMRPLLRLRAASGEIAAGRLDVDIPAYHSRSEIGALYGDFSAMVRDLRASRAEIEEYNRTLEQRIAQRTWELQGLLDNMDEGLFTIGPEGAIDPRFSAATKAMLGEPVEDANFVERLSADEAVRRTVRDTFGLLLGGALMLDWDDMVANLPSELEGQGGRWLKARYRPVYDIQGEHIERVMVILRDITHEKALQQDIDRNRDRQTMVVQIIQNRETFELFYEDAQRLLRESIQAVQSMNTVNRGVVDAAFRTMHTIKGTAGLFGFREAAALAHETEDTLRDLNGRRDAPFAAAEREALAGRLAATLQALEEGRREFMHLVGEDEAERGVTLPESRIDRLVAEALAAVPAEAAARAGAILKRLKHVPTTRLLRKYRSLVETTAERLGKQAQLVLQDQDETDMPPEFFQQLDPTFLHIIRNSLDHGIEDLEGRMAAGKEPLATITCASSRRNGSIVFSIGDDGRGIDLERVRQVAIDRGFLKAERAEAMSRQDILRLLFLPGFSSKDTVTDLSGRGVGLDVVAKDVERLHGRMRVITRPGKGTTFELHYPLPA